MVSNTSVSTNLLESFNVVTQLAVYGIGQQLRVLAIGNVLLSVQKPVGNLELGRVLQDLDDSL